MAQPGPPAEAHEGHHVHHPYEDAGRDHPVNEILPPGRMFIFGLQHVASMYAPE